MAIKDKAEIGSSLPSKARKLLVGGIGVTVLLVLAVMLWAMQATATRHSVGAANLGVAVDHAALAKSLTTGATVILQTIDAADWHTDLSGLVNLNHPRAKAAGLEDRSEPIKIYAFHIVHPEHGDFLIDTGVARSFAESPESEGVPGWLVPQLGIDQMEVLTTTDSYLSELDRPIRGVFLSHMHMDHISGLPAIDKEVPLYVGMGEATTAYFLNAATRGAVDALLEGRPALREWSAPVADVFNDGSVFAIHSPGHTAGSTAFLINTTTGPVLLTGDVSHTAWGWNHKVEPGKFSMDQPRSRTSLNILIQLVEENPEIEVRLGHQPL